MTDDGLEPDNVTGRWVGFLHNWEKVGTFPLIADLRQNGDRITGKMYDQMRDRSNYVGNSVAILGEQTPIDIRTKFEQAIRQLDTETVLNSRLPDTSDLRGKITGSEVHLTKTYRGLEITCIAGEKQAGTFRRDGHKVQYSGDFDRDRMCIVGTWVMTQSGLPGRFPPTQARGSFELYRKS